MKYLKKMNEGFRDWFKSEDRPKKSKTINLEDECKLRFTKDNYEYIMSFYNPLKDEYWDMPSYDVGIHAPWSFEKKGSYGAYDLHKIKCSFHEIDGWKRTFRTYADIQQHFDKINKDYERWQERFRKDRELPDVVQ